MSALPDAQKRSRDRRTNQLLTPSTSAESRWAAPKNASGQLDHHAALTGDDLRDFVNVRLFPYLERFTQSASGPNTIEYKIGEVFGEL